MNVTLLEALAGRRVLVLGDVMLDRYVFGAVERISPEAPIPVLRLERRAAALGGAGNVAHNIAALGGVAVLIGAVGADEAGAELAQALAAVPGAGGGSIEARLVTVAGRRTTVKTRFVAGRQQLLRLDEEEAGPLGSGAAEAVLESFGQALAGVAAVVLSDYAKGVLSPAVLARAIEAARAAGKPVIADPKSLDFARYHGVSVLTPNRLEAARATGLEVADDDGAERAARLAQQAIGGGAVLVTRSEQGLTLVEAEMAALHLPTRARAVADVSGAGDTVVATLALALAAGASLAEAAALANVAAGLSVAKPGTATVGRGELVAALHLREVLAAEDKIVDAEAAAARVAAWRAEGLVVGFTNGCFDLIHPGHVGLLARARAACDRLVVGLNTDELVRRLKGADRPVQGEAARATVLASLAAVDLVVPFAEDTPLTLIERLRPEVLIKGADYRVDQVVGADLVAGWGGRVELVDLVAGHSTTGTIARIGGRGVRG